MTAQPSDAGVIVHGVAKQLAPMVVTWRTIIAEHTRNEAGYCSAPTCGRPGYGTRDWQVHPCVAAYLALLARSKHRAGRPGSQ